MNEQPIELHRHLTALRRARIGLAAFVLAATAAALGISLALPKSYQSTARILFDPSVDPLSAQSSDVIQRQLATYASLIQTPAVIDRAANRLGETGPELGGQISVAADQVGNLLTVTGTARTPTDAQQRANAVTDAFLTAERTQDLRRIAAGRAKLRAELAGLGGAPGNRQQAQALEVQLSDLTVSEATAGSELSLAEAAQKPGSPASPKVALDAVVAFFAALFVGVLFVLGREQLVPRLAGARDLTRITELPVLGTVPFVRRRFGRTPKVLSGQEHEAYQTLQAAIRFQLPPDEQRIVLLTSARDGEGKTTATVNLGRALARAGHRTLLVSADMRHPRLHEPFGLEAAPGLSEVLTALERDGELPQQRTIAALRGVLAAQAGAHGRLHVLPAGKKPAEPARLLLSQALDVFVAQLRTMEYDYVLLDGTPLLGLADAQALAQRADAVIVVSRLDRLSAEDVSDLRDVVERLDVSPLGHVVIGGRRVSASQYYVSTPAEPNLV